VRSALPYARREFVIRLSPVFAGQRWPVGKGHNCSDVIEMVTGPTRFKDWVLS